MKKLYYLLIFIFSFSVLSAQEKLSKEEQARREKNIQAGNPFVKYGCKAPVATLSKGKYLEVQDLDSIVTIGTSRWDVDNKKVVGDIVQDTLNIDAQPIGDIAGHWMSPDPLTEEFPSTSPYVAFNNNPVRFTDPTGMAPEDCCDGLLGFVVGAVDNIAGTHYRNNGSGRDFNNGVRTADVVSLVGGSYLAAKGLFDIGAGTTGLTASVAVTAGTGGLAIEVTGPAAAVSAGLIGVGTAETLIGGNIAINAMNNLKNDNSSSNNSSSSEDSSRKSNPKKEAREAGKANRENQPASEKRAKDYGKQVERESGKDARRAAHDAKDNIGRDRTVKELKEDYNRK